MTRPTSSPSARARAKPAAQTASWSPVTPVVLPSSWPTPTRTSSISRRVCSPWPWRSSAQDRRSGITFTGRFTPARDPTFGAAAGGRAAVRVSGEAPRGRGRSCSRVSRWSGSMSAMPNCECAAAALARQSCCRMVNLRTHVTWHWVAPCWRSSSRPCARICRATGESSKPPTTSGCRWSERVVLLRLVVGPLTNRQLAVPVSGQPKNPSRATVPPAGWSGSIAV